MSDDYVLVTGVSGFIASGVAQKLLAQGIKVIGVDNLNDYYEIKLKQFRLNELSKNKNFKFFKEDIENFPFLKNLFAEYNFKTVYNLAARAGVRYSVENPFIYVNTNLSGTLNILELMKNSKGSHFIMASTSSLYAGASMPFVEENAVNQPISPYAASKKAAEVMSYTYNYLYGVNVSILRYFTVYGPSGRPDMSVLRFIKSAIEGDKVNLFGDGTQSRDFTYIDDIVDGTIKSAALNGYNIINLGGGNNPISMNKLISVIEEKTKAKVNIVKKNFQKEDMDSTWADIKKAKSLLKWEPKVSIEQGIENTVKWYKQNREFLRDLKF